MLAESQPSHQPAHVNLMVRRFFSSSVRVAVSKMKDHTSAQAALYDA
jgi:hypothetical protein